MIAHTREGKKSCEMLVDLTGLLANSSKKISIWEEGWNLNAQMKFGESQSSFPFLWELKVEVNHHLSVVWDKI